MRVLMIAAYCERVKLDITNDPSSLLEELKPVRAPHTEPVHALVENNALNTRFKHKSSDRWHLGQV